MQKAEYEILRKIGHRRLRVVYEGRDPFIKRRVAIKTCTSEDEEMRQRFFREAEIAGNLEQKNIVTIFDFGFEDGVPYLVQEYLPGEDLDHKITRKDPLTAPQKVEILLQVAQGLAYAHSRGNSPRHQAGQHHAARARRGEDHGLRHRAHAPRRP
jgi:serine/threonine-protein kinase